MSGAIHRADAADGVVVLEIDNPPMNAMSSYMLKQMAEVLGELEGDSTIRAVVLTGRGRAFCSGADLKEAARGGGEDLASFGRMLEMVAASRAPVIAAINGHCVGGGLELALCCDLRIASTEARFVCAGVNVGLMASTYRLPRLIGVSRAKAMLLTGLPHDAARAEAWGLVTEVHAPGALAGAALALAQRIASRAPLSVEASKRVIDRALDMSPAEYAQMQAQELPALRHSADHKEAVTAFAERREPKFNRR
ncbi:MAG TPA: enoyl-CoA hydratase-related protein [Candidatus Saccharimonadales bacterium]|nr:enoyl-CoA hydratase-related protein [Candidatus Saccharimonadales bacterium]